MTQARATSPCLLLLAVAFTPTLSAQTTPRPATPWINRSLVFLDPAHGGDDPGAQLADHTAEKDATLALALRLRALLSASGITVLLAREPAPAPQPAADPLQLQPAAPPAPPNPEARAGAANHAHPFACILLHATGAGSGIHIVTSPLPPSDPSDNTPSTPVPWATAQSAFVAQSNHLAAGLATAISRAGLPAHRLQSSVRPIDSLTCPAVAVELGPVNGTSASSPDYQARVAQALSTALQFSRGQLDDDARAAQAAAASGTEP